MQLQPLPCDTLSGYLVRVGGARAWVVGITGELPDELPYEVFYRGELSIYYGLALLYEEDEALLVQFAMDDFRREYHGAAALDFALRKGDAFPRGDIIGRRARSGRPHAAFIREVDLARGIQAFVFASPEALTPLAQLDAMIWVEAEVEGLVLMPGDDERVPALLRRAVVCLRIAPGALPDLPELIGRNLPFDLHRGPGYNPTHGR